MIFDEKAGVWKSSCDGGAGTNLDQLTVCRGWIAFHRWCCGAGSSVLYLGKPLEAIGWDWGGMPIGRGGAIVGECVL
jgi:hypothetical protein